MLVMKDPAFQEKFITSRGQVTAINTPEKFAKQIVEERARAKEVVKQSGVDPRAGTRAVQSRIVSFPL